jgi:magnesium chelatase accessory protein
MMYTKPKWSVEGRNWPNRTASAFVKTAELVFHVQRFGIDANKPNVLLIHGTGAATHSWAALIPFLQPHYNFVAFDLPGHGFTATPQGRDLSLKGMARLISGLLKTLSFAPDIIIAHSAGAVIGVELCLSGQAKPQRLIAINGAFKPFEGLAAKVFPVAAKLIALNPLTIHALALSAKDPSRVQTMLESTGSKIDKAGLGHYTALFSASGHVGAVMGMMARWDLAELAPRMAKLATPLTLIVGEGDLAVPPKDAVLLAKSLPSASLVSLAGVGHLAHEEDASAVAAAILAAIAEVVV